MRKKSLIIIISFLPVLCFIIINEYLFGPAKKPGAKPLHLDKITSNLWDYIFSALGLTIISILAYRADNKAKH